MDFHHLPLTLLFASLISNDLLSHHIGRLNCDIPFIGCPIFTLYNLLFLARRQSLGSILDHTWTCRLSGL